jgi:uncharacterized metal-binding protein YceD (DUF177 family)
MSKPEFSVLAPLSSIPAEGRRFDLSAPQDVLPALAQRLRVPAVKSLEGQLTVTPTRNGVDIQGVLNAALIRECVASLETMDERIREPFSLIFERPSESVETAIEIDADSPEPLESDTLDLGEILVQQTALSMAPHPRKEGAPGAGLPRSEPENISPFAALKGAIAPSRGEE